MDDSMIFYIPMVTTASDGEARWDSAVPAFVLIGECARARERRRG